MYACIYVCVRVCVCVCVIHIQYTSYTCIWHPACATVPKGTLSCAIHRSKLAKTQRPKCQKVAKNLLLRSLASMYMHLQYTYTCINININIYIYICAGICMDMYVYIYIYCIYIYIYIHTLPPSKDSHGLEPPFVTLSCSHRGATMATGRRYAAQLKHSQKVPRLVRPQTRAHCCRRSLAGAGWENPPRTPGQVAGGICRKFNWNGLNMIELVNLDLLRIIQLGSLLIDLLNGFTAGSQI